jgi:hypothetical protein
MLMSWKSLAAAALVAGLCAAPAARADNLIKLALPAKGDATAQTLALKGDADTLAVGWHGHYSHRGYYRYPYRYWPRYSFSIGFGYVPPAYYYAPPVYCYSPPPVYIYSTPAYASPISLGVETYSAPGGAATYSVTRPGAGGPEQVQPPLPRDGSAPGTFPYDGGPDNPVPMPQADPTKVPRLFHMVPLDELRVSLPAQPAQTKDAGRGKYVYPAYGEEPRRADPAGDRNVAKTEKK